MKKNPMRSTSFRESVKGTISTTASGISGGKAAGVAVAVASALGVAVEYLGELGAKRTEELFDNEELVNKIVAKISESDNFASFVFDVWQKHNFESSIKRRRMLKVLLEKEAGSEVNNFENFSKIEFLMQNMSIPSLQLLKFFNTKMYRASFYDKEGRVRNPHLEDIHKLAQENDYNIPIEDLEYRMSDLVSNGLAFIRQGLWDGPQYNQATLGFLLLEYIADAID